MPNYSLSFMETWNVGRRVQEIAVPHRKGTVRNVFGTGPNARVLVALDGLPAATFYPAQLEPLFS